mmetsp:Transcript_95/g.94  ORF Transcript_95/g.94 Transcript_95/m.94 type:complete len:243 (+) Transcript_95:86-814(+)
MSAPACRGCIQQSDTKWCKLKTSATSGRCCILNELSEECSGVGDYICSNNNEIEDNGGYLLCPIDPACGEREIKFGHDNFIATVEANFINADTLCIYKITSSISYFDKVRIQLDDVSSAKVQVFSEEDPNEFELEETLDLDDNDDDHHDDHETVEVEDNQAAYVLVTPEGPNASVKFHVIPFDKGLIILFGVSIIGTLGLCCLVCGAAIIVISYFVWARFLPKQNKIVYCHMQPEEMSMSSS